MSWRLSGDGYQSVTYRWDDDPHVTMTFSDEGLGMSVQMMYDTLPVGDSFHIDRFDLSYIRKVLDSVEDSMEWFSEGIRELLGEMSDKVGKDYQEVMGLID